MKSNDIETGAEWIGLVGCGKWGQHILRDLRALGYRVAVVTRSDASTARAHQGEADAVVPSLLELTGYTPRGVVVATSTHTHYEVILELLSLFPSQPLFVEKPVTTSLVHARRLLELAPERIFVMDKWRYHPGVQTLAQIVRSGSLGRLLGVRTERLGWGSPHPDSNAVWHLLPHDLMIVKEILGHIPTTRHRYIEKHLNGVVGIQAVLGEAPYADCRVSCMWPHRIRKVQIVCTEGVAMLEDGYSPVVRVTRSPLYDGDRIPEFEDIPLSSELPLLLELKAFSQFIRGEGPPPKSSLAEATEVVDTIEALLTE